MHPLSSRQKTILKLVKNGKIDGNMSLRKMAKIMGVENKPEIISYALRELEKRNLIRINLRENILIVSKRGYQNYNRKNALYYLPIVNNIISYENNN